MYLLVRFPFHDFGTKAGKFRFFILLVINLSLATIEFHAFYEICIDKKS